MKKITLFLFLSISLCYSQQQTGTFTITPSNFTATDEITITVSGVDPTIWNAGEPDNMYLWAWYFDQCGDIGGPVNGTGDWENSAEYLQMTNNGDGTYSYILTPSVFYADSNISEIGVLAKAKDGRGDKKTQDHLEWVGNGIVVDFSDPASTPAVLNSGDDLTIKGTFSSEGSLQYGTSYEVFYNEVSQGTSSNGFPIFQFDLTNLTISGTVRVEATISGESSSCSFDVIIAPTVTEQSVPAGMEDGINYDSGDNTTATLVLNAPLKDFVYVSGSWNNYTPGPADLMKRDPSTGKYWLQVNGLNPGTKYHYQYQVFQITPTANSPQRVVIADPFSTTILSAFDDPWIPASSYPNIPIVPNNALGIDATLLEPGNTAYPWVVTNFNKPKKEDLIIYEVLIRDFDANRNFQDLIDRIDYFKNLKINAIQLMPVMEFEGNESWGYNTSHHMALDKFYGTEDKFKEFIDLCHQNGIAVILDLALNHAFGRNPLLRMWMDDPDGNGFGPPTSENPYFNLSATHSYSVGDDFNHSQPLTQYYTERVIKHWIEEFKIDGFRWDLTKGFTQNCTASDEGCTNSYQQDRVDRLKAYADYSWSLDETHYVIFEHLGSDSEEQQWANYRLGDAVPKGIMMWSEMWGSYKDLANGNATNFDRMGHVAHGFTAKRALGYPESHDKDRLMYEMTEFGGGSGFDLNTSLSRMSAIGAVTIPIPGPKMIWHFADLGMDDSIWTCNDGSVNSDYDGNNDGDCKLDTKPQPQWAENWLGDPNRSQVRSDWARLIELKINEAVFEGSYTISSGTLTPKINVYTGDLNTPGSELKNVLVLANFSTSSQNVIPDFPYTGTWYDLMDGTGSTSVNVTSTTDPISIPAGGFKIYGNQSSITLDTDDILNQESFAIFPNPVTDSFQINKKVGSLRIYDITGKVISEFNGNFIKGDSFDVSNLLAGIYIVELENNFSQRITTKLIKL